MTDSTLGNQNGYEQEFKETQDMLADLFAEVSELEAMQGDEEELGRAGKAIMGLRETRVKLGDPTDNLTRLTPSRFEELGIPLDDGLRRQMEEGFDFYYMTLHILLFPERGAEFKLLECQLDFGSEGDAKRPIVQTIFPQLKWRPVLEWGGGMTLALNGTLGWEAGFKDDEFKTVLQLKDIPLAYIKNQNDLKGYVVVRDYSFVKGRLQNAATGKGANACNWRIEDDKLSQELAPNFVVVFKVPKDTEEITLTGVVAAETSIDWLTSELDF